MTVLDTQMVEMEEVQKPQPTQQGGWYVPSVYMGAPANYLVQYLPPAPAHLPKRSAWFHVLTAPLQPRTFGLYAYYMLLVPIFMILSLCTIAPFFWVGIGTSVFGVGVLLLFFGLLLARMFSAAHVKFMKVFVNFTNIDDMVTDKICLGVRPTLKSPASWGAALLYQLFWPIYWCFAMFIIKGFFCLTMFCMTMMLVKAAAPTVDPFDASVHCGWLCTKKALLLWTPCFVMSLYCTTWSAVVFAHLERVIVFKAFTKKQDSYSYQLFHNQANPAQPIVVPVATPRQVNRTCSRVCWRGLSTCFWFISIIVSCLVCLHVALLVRCKITEHSSFNKSDNVVLHTAAGTQVKTVAVQINLPAACYWMMQRNTLKPTVTIVPTSSEFVTFNASFKYLGAHSNMKFVSSEYDGRVNFEARWADGDAYFVNVHACPHLNVEVHVPNAVALNVSISGAFTVAEMTAVKNVKHLSLNVYTAYVWNFVGSLSIGKHSKLQKMQLSGTPYISVQNSVIDRLYMKARASLNVEGSQLLNHVYVKAKYVDITGTRISASEVTIKKAKRVYFYNVWFDPKVVQTVNITGRFIDMNDDFTGLVVMNPRGTVEYRQNIHEYCPKMGSTSLRLPSSCPHKSVMTLTTKGHFRYHRGRWYGSYINYNDVRSDYSERVVNHAQKAIVPEHIKDEVEGRRFSWFG